jgi:hypothetical protein
MMENPPNEAPNMPFPIDYFDDNVEEMALPATLERLTILAADSKRLESEISADAVALAEKQAKQDKILRELIPNVMTELGMSQFKLTDGSVVEVKDDLRAGITEANKPAAFKWLEDEHYDGIIKTKVMSEFGKGEASKVAEAVAALEKAGFSASTDRSVHPATLKSFVKERLEEGDSIPVELFGVFEFKIAKIKLPKAKK